MECVTDRSKERGQGFSQNLENPGADPPASKLPMKLVKIITGKTIGNRTKNLILCSWNTEAPAP
jgi:hypothetical protein